MSSIRQLVDAGDSVRRRPERRKPTGGAEASDTESDFDTAQVGDDQSDTSSVATDTSETSLTEWRKQNEQSRASGDPPWEWVE